MSFGLLACSDLCQGHSVHRLLDSEDKDCVVFLHSRNLVGFHICICAIIACLQELSAAFKYCKMWSFILQAVLIMTKDCSPDLKYLFSTGGTRSTIVLANSRAAILLRRGNCPLGVWGPILPKSMTQPLPWSVQRLSHGAALPKLSSHTHREERKNLINHNYNSGTHGTLCLSSSREVCKLMELLPHTFVRFALPCMIVKLCLTHWRVLSLPSCHTFDKCTWSVDLILRRQHVIEELWVVGMASTLYHTR